MNIAVFWDIENVTPPAYSGYVQSIIDFITKDGKLSYAMSFGNWNKDNIRGIASELSKFSFELIHIPASIKNSADMSLVAHGVETIFKLPHIGRFVLISGDADFRPLLTSCRKYGKETWVICDVNNNASEELLKISDRYFDYRNIIEEEEDAEDKSDEVIITREQAFDLFEEAICLMQKEEKKPALGSVKIKMQLLNENFDEKQLGYRNWTSFILDALKNTAIEYDEDKKIFFKPKPDIKSKEDNIPEVFQILISEVKEKNKWILFTDVAKKLHDKKIDIGKYGYSKFMKLVMDAEKRGYVKTRNNGLIWSLQINQFSQDL
ncbi:MAG: NYN domain-containing protein [Actinobacteria bacterium]|nr:NYN domain-containing protein [Actinomycetota bacterium]